MNAVKILVLCIAAALICASLRTVYPQVASAVALAAGVGAMMLSRADIAVFADALRVLDGLTDDGGRLTLLKICAIAIVAEFASDICRDAGEGSLAKRIDTGVRIGIVVTAVPAAGSIIYSIAEMIG